MKKMILPVLFTGLLAVSCSKKEEVKQETKVTEVQTTTTTDTTSNLSGNYEGTIPCADCPGIETKLTLNQDETFVLERNYLESKNGKSSEKGTYEVEEVQGKGKFIKLDYEKDNEPDTFLFVAEDGIYMVSEIGNSEVNPQYKLAKK